jgi:hypothetical protein
MARRVFLLSDGDRIMVALAKPLNQKQWRNEPTDIGQVALALSDAGYYKLPGGQRNPLFWMPEPRLFEGVKAFQREHGLRVDGVVNPGGETERRLNTILGQTGQDGSAAVDRPQAATREPSNQQAARPQMSAEDQAYAEAVERMYPSMAAKPRAELPTGQSFDDWDKASRGKEVLMADARSGTMTDAGAETGGVHYEDLKRSYPAIPSDKAAKWDTCTWPSGKGANKPGVEGRPCTTSLPGKGTPEQRVWQMRNELEAATAAKKHIKSASDGDSEECVVLVKHFHPELGPASGWKQGQSIGDVPNIRPGDAFARGFVGGKYTNMNTGNHAIIIYDVHYDAKGNVATVDYAEQAAERWWRPAFHVKIVENAPIAKLVHAGFFIIEK